MIITHDPEVDAAYIYLSGKTGKGEAVNQRHCGSDIILDFNRVGQLIGIELLTAKLLSPELLAMAVSEAEL